MKHILTYLIYLGTCFFFYRHENTGPSDWWQFSDIFRKTLRQKHSSSSYRYYVPTLFPFSDAPPHDLLNDISFKTIPLIYFFLVKSSKTLAKRPRSTIPYIFRVCSVCHYYPLETYLSKKKKKRNRKVGTPSNNFFLTIWDIFFLWIV